jgi:hypothetical protein
MKVGSPYQTLDSNENGYSINNPVNVPYFKRDQIQYRRNYILNEHHLSKEDSKEKVKKMKIRIS